MYDKVFSFGGHMVADQIIDFNTSLKPPKGLPGDVKVMNPYKDQTALELSNLFFNKYFSDNNPRKALFGINPGRFGGGITGIPFTDPVILEQICGFPNPFDKRAELSSRFIYEMINSFGGPSSFYKGFYITGMSPLGYTRDGKNLNYYDLKEWKPIFIDYAARMIEAQLPFLDRSVAFSIGRGENLKFLESLNNQHGFFTTIEVVPHPRWVMQYRLKRKQEFINQYLTVLKGD